MTSPEPAPQSDAAARAKRAAKYAALFGVLLAVACRLVPERYQSVCEAIAQVCTAGVSR